MMLVQTRRIRNTPKEKFTKTLPWLLLCVCLLGGGYGLGRLHHPAPHPVHAKPLTQTPESLYETYLKEKDLCGQIQTALNESSIDTSYEIRQKVGILAQIESNPDLLKHPAIRYGVSHWDAFQISFFEGGFVVQPSLQRYYEIQLLDPKSEYGAKIYIDFLTLELDHNLNPYGNMGVPDNLGEILTGLGHAIRLYGSTNSDLIQFKKDMLHALKEKEKEIRNQDTPTPARKSDILADLAQIERDLKHLFK